MLERDPPADKTVGQRPRDMPESVFASAAAGGNVCVVGIGSSAGGLLACKEFLKALPPAPGMVFILVQHMDPTHESLMAEILKEDTSMPVSQAKDGMVVEIDHLYIIPPGVYLSFSGGALHLSAPLARHGARLPFDFLLHSLAAAAGARSVCVILSGTGADGSIGLKAIKAAGGLVIVQDPVEAEYDGMARSALATGDVDFTLPAAKIAHQLLSYRAQLDKPLSNSGLTEITALLRDHTPHDFTLYKPGTLQRRIARRLAMCGFAADDMNGYIKLLRDNEAERTQLAEDLLINVTSFFRDPKTFDILTSTIIPQILEISGDRPIRIWVAGCSTGEETYSLAISFQEVMLASGSNAKLQIFASDVDAQAVGMARDGHYSTDIEQLVSAKRLAQFFTKEDNGYRISTVLRGSVVFAVQDVLADPPFSKLDLISCRNLMIYLQPEAQEKIISIFNFALRRNGFLLLGSAETVGIADNRFTIISKSGRIYQKTAPSAPGDLMFSRNESEMTRAVTRILPFKPPVRALDIAEFCKRLVLMRHAPAAILVNQRLECLYSSGPTELYLRLAPGYPTNDILSMIQPALRARAKAALNDADNTNTRIVVSGGRIVRDGQSLTFNIDVQPVTFETERLLLICFIDQPKSQRYSSKNAVSDDLSRVADLEHELSSVRAELRTALHSLEISRQEQNAVNEEALSINEEFQSTNEELLTSKEELQSLNEELTALNSQLQETLERSRMTSNDLQNVLYSTDVATLFLDTDLKIKFFTPATRALFTLIAGDIGRPLADLHSLSADAELPADARSVLKHFVPIEREIQGQNATWFNRRILPYRTHEDAVAGVVITFTDITERKNTAAALQNAQRESETANIAKTRFLAAASHDLRQPLQTLTLLNSLLSKAVDNAPAQKLLAKLDETTNAMTGILNTLLDINQIDAGVIQAEIISYPINELLLKLASEFTYLAGARGLVLHMVPCSLYIYTDPRILEQMIRNLISNAIKYTNSGGILLGCRRHGKTISIEVWDTGIGMPAYELTAIFDEYHQLDNAARERSRGLGLGLSIVQRLSKLLQYKISVRSVQGKGSVFAIEAPISDEPGAMTASAVLQSMPVIASSSGAGSGKILVIEDDPDICQLLEMFLTEEGHQVAVARDGVAAFKLMETGTLQPDLILADYNLPNGSNGLEVITELRKMQSSNIAVVIVTGDISTETMQRIAQAECIQMTKPMRLGALNNLIQHLLISKHLPAAAAKPIPILSAAPEQDTIFIVDDDRSIRETLRAVFEAEGNHVMDFPDCESFLAGCGSQVHACLLVDANLPGMSGIELLQKLSKSTSQMPAIMITGEGDVKMAVRAMKAGAFDFIEKPVSHIELLAAVDRAFRSSKNAETANAVRELAAAQIASLTARQRQIMDLVLAGHPSKNIAADLGISQRTVENHRASIMEKTGTKSVAALARLAIGSLSSVAPANDALKVVT